MKFDDTPSKEEREDFWLDLGPASAYEGLDCAKPPAVTATPARTALPTALRARKARKISCLRPMTTRTVSRCPTCRPS